MDNNLYEASRLKGVDIPSLNNADYILHRTPNEENVLHIAAQHGNNGFIETVLDRFPEQHYALVCHQNSQGETPLHLAAQFGDEATVEALLAAHDRSQVSDEKKLCWRVWDKRGDTPLHKALRCGHDDVALLLLQRDMGSVSRRNNLSESPAYLAAENFCLRFLRTILDAQHYDQTSVSFSGPLGQTVFHPARKLTGDIMALLIQNRPELLKVQDSKGKTVLHYAVEEKREPLVKTLLNANSSLAYLRDKDGLTPLHRAAMMGLTSMIQLILELSPQSIHTRTILGQTALHVAKTDAPFLAGCLINTRLKELINVADHQGNTPLHLASAASNLDVVNTLLGVRGISWRMRNNDGCTPMDLCESHDQIPNKLKHLESTWSTKEVVDMSIFNHKNVKTMKDLLYHYPFEECLTYKGCQGNSIFHIAARDGCMEFIDNEALKSRPHSRLLMLSGQNSKGETPFHLAAKRGHLKVVQAILQLSISTDRLGNEKATTRLCVVESGREYEEADIKPWKMTSVNGDTPLHKAVRNGHEKVARCLLRCDLELSASENEASESVMYLAAQSGCFGVIRELLGSARYAFSVSGPNGKNPLHAFGLSGLRFNDSDSYEALCDLVERRPDLANKVDKEGKTPLHYAVEQNNTRIVRKLLRVDKSTTFVYDNQGLTPLLRAAAKGHRDCEHAIRDLCPHSEELQDLRSETFDDHHTQKDELVHAPSFKRRVKDLLFRDTRHLAAMSQEDLNRLLNNMALAATLFVTLAFAATFTIPGGYDQTTGQVLRMKEKSIQAFLFLDVLATMMGLGVLITYTFGITGNRKVLVAAAICSLRMIEYSMISAIGAYLTGIYALAFADDGKIFFVSVVLPFIIGVLVIMGTSKMGRQLVVPDRLFEKDE